MRRLSAYLALAGLLIPTLAFSQVAGDGAAPIDSSDATLEEPGGQRGDGKPNWRALPLFESVWDSERERRERSFLWPLFTTSSGEHGWSFKLRPFFGVEVDEADDSSELDVLWPLFHREQLGEESWTSLRPLFWSHSAPEEGYNHLFPLWYSSWSEDHTTIVSPVGPLVILEREGRWDVHLWPLFGRHDLAWGGTRWFSLGHAVWADTGRGEAGSFAAPAPLLMAQWGPDGYTVVALPLLFSAYRQGDLSWSTAFPFYFKHETAPDRWRLLTIPYSYTRDGSDWRHDVLFPFVTYAGNDEGTESSVSVRPLFWYDHDAERDWSLLAPLYYRYLSADEETSRLWTLPYVYNREGGDWRHDVLFPFVTYAGNDAGTESSVSVRPLFWYDHDAERDWSLLAPLYYRYLSADEETSRLWTLPYVYNREGGDWRHDVLFPFVTYAGNDEGTESSVSVRPLFWYDRDAEGAWSMLLPFYHYYQSTDETISRLTTIPFMWSETAESQGWDVFWPLISHHQARDDSSRSIRALPFFWFDRSPERTASVFFPFWVSHAVDDTFRLLTLPWWYREDAHSVRNDVLWPLFTQESAKDGSEDFVALRPFFWYDRNDERTHTAVLPLFYDYQTDDEHSLFTPLYWYRDSPEETRHDVLWPFLSWASNDEDEFSLSVRPFVFYDSGPERSSLLALPLGYYEREGDDVLGYGIPFFFHRERGDEATTVIPPVFWRFLRGEEETVHVWPFFSYASEPGYEQFSTLWPLFAWGSGPERAHARALPLFLHDREGETSFTTVFPLYWAHERPGRTVRMVLPSYYYLADEEAQTETEIFLPFYVGRESPNAEFQTWGGLYWHWRQDARESWLVPPVFHSADEEDGASSTCVFPFYWGFRDRGSADADLVSPFEDVGTETDVVFPLYWRFRDHDEQSATDVVFPFYWRHRDQVEQSATDVVFPFYWRHRAPEEELDSILSLYWNYSDHGKSGRVFFPLYWGFSDETQGSDTDVVFPLYWSFEEEHSSFRALFPLWWSSSSQVTLQDGSTQTNDVDVVFPLYWRQRSATAEHDVVAPLYWYFRRGDWSFRALLPFYLSSEDEESSLTMAGGLYWSSERDGDVTRTVLPLYWDLDPEGPDRTIHLWPLFAWERDGDYTAASTLWPLFTWGSGDERSRLDVLWPLGSHQIDATSTHSRFLPLYLYDSDPDGWSCDLVWPLVQLRGDEESSSWSLLYHLASYESDPGGYDFRVLRWLYRNAQQGDTADHYLLPLWKYSRQGELSDLWVLWPLVDYESAGADSSFAFLWQFFTYSSSPDTTECRVFYKLFEYRSAPEEGVLALNPFFAYDWGPDEELFQLFGGVYYRHWKRGQETTDGLFWGLAEF